MTTEMVLLAVSSEPDELMSSNMGGRLTIPRIIENAGEQGRKRFFEFFTVTIRN